MMVALNRSCPKASRLVELNFTKSELQTQEEFRNSLFVKQEVARLEKMTSINNQAILTRLVQLGFGVETIDAVKLIPIALVAWASGKVEQNESKIAWNGIANIVTCIDDNILELFKSWLREKPSQALAFAWRDYTRCKVQTFGVDSQRNEGVAILDLANRVAAAAGGFLGIQAICRSEQSVLNEIRNAYSLNPVTAEQNPASISTPWILADQLRV